MALTPLSTLRVTSQTTLDDLEAFQKRIGKDDAKLRATANKDGSFTLKAVDRDSSFLSRMFGVSKSRRDDARSALTMVMTNSGAVDRKPTGSLTKLINADRAHAPRSSALKLLIDFAKSERTAKKEAIDRSSIKGGTHEAELLKRKFPDLKSSNLSQGRIDAHLKNALETVELGPLNDTQVEELADGLGNEIYSQLVQNGPLSKNQSAMLGVSDIEGFVKNAFENLAPDPKSVDTKDAISRISKEVANRLSETLLGSKHISDDSFSIGTEVFTKVDVEALGQGGFGKAILYRCAATGREVVLKIPANASPDAPKEEVAKRNFNFKSEIDMHTKIMDSSDRKYPHVLQFEGVVRLPGGLIGTVTEACTSGDMSKAIKRIDKAVTDGVLTAEQAMAAKLTLMRDMIDGQKVISGRGFSHRDVKFQNVFVDAKGVGKVADFGESAFGNTFSLSKEKIGTNPMWLAPENMVNAEKIGDFDKTVREARLGHLKAKLEVFNALVGKGGMLANLGLNQINAVLDEGSVDFVMNDLLAEIAKVPKHSKLITAIVNDNSGDLARRYQSAIDLGKNQLPANTQINGEAADVWSFGAAAVVVAVGDYQSVNAGRWQAASEKKVLEYFNAKPTDPGNGGPPVPPPEALVPGSFLNADFQMKPNGTATGDAELDDLINQCLRRDPDTRPSFADLLKHPIFRRDGVGDTATRNVIAAICGNPPKTNDEIQNLATNMTV